MAWPAFVHGVEQIEIQVRHIQLFQLLVQQPVHVLFLVHRPAGQLGGQRHPFPIAVLEGQAHHNFAFPFVVGIGGVHIRNAFVDAMPDHADGLFPVDHGPLAVLFCGQAHTAKAQARNVKTMLTKGYILHCIPSSLIMDRCLSVRFLLPVPVYSIRLVLSTIDFQYMDFISFGLLPGSFLGGTILWMPKNGSPQTPFQESKILSC